MDIRHTKRGGKILKIHVGVGQVVTTGMPLYTYEKLKMETTVLSPCAGVVRSVTISTGQSMKEIVPPWANEDAPDWLYGAAETVMIIF